MKKMFLIMIAAALLVLPAVGAAETGSEEEQEMLANIGDVTFSFTNEQEYFDVFYMYPDEFELEIKEDGNRVRHILRYYVEGYEKPAVGLVISRTNEYTPEERLADIAFIDEITTEEINGVSWVIGTDTDPSTSSVIIYVRAAGEYTYTFSFSSEYPAEFDYADFARVFAEKVTIPDAD